jgi:hypothetical protein
MKKCLWIVAACMMAGAGGWAGSLSVGEPARSSYIGKKWMAFEFNNGPSYRWEKLKDGGSLQYWRSDIAGCCIGNDDDGAGSRCDLLIRLDADRIIREIRITEHGIACPYALR